MLTMIANLIDPRVGSIAAGHNSEFLPEFLPEPEFEVRLSPVRPSHAVYVRRRLLVCLLLVALCVAVGVTVRSVLADRGGVPASTPAVQPAALAGAALLPGGPATAATYIVQPGDTLWSIAGRLRGQATMSDYLDTLVASNGGASVQAGQLLTLP